MLDMVGEKDVEEQEQYKSIDAVLAECEYSLFTATDRNNLLDDYPELREYPEFMELRNKPKDMLWVWHFACRSSPLKELHTERERVTAAVKIVWPNAEEQELFDLIHRFMNREKEIQDAVMVMRNFRPEGRFVRHVACEQMIKMARAVMDEDPRKVKDIVDPSKKKAFLEAMSVALDLIDQAVKMSESGSGKVTKKEANRKRGSALARVHSSQQVEA
jgi:hypothetical protein